MHSLYNTMRLLLACTVSAATVAAPDLHAQNTAPLPPSMSAHASADAAQRLVNFITSINRDEIAAGRLAMTKATRPEVRTLASQIVEAHIKSMAAWAKAVPSLSLTIPDTINSTATTPRAMATSSAASDGVSEVRDTTTGLRGGTTAAAIHSANIASLADLKGASGARFDSLYLAGRIESHDAVLKELASQPAIYEELQTLLTTFRRNVEENLAVARKLQR